MPLQMLVGYAIDIAIFAHLHASLLAPASLCSHHAAACTTSAIAVNPTTTPFGQFAFLSSLDMLSNYWV
jgi:hypothetical protein